MAEDLGKVKPCGCPVRPKQGAPDTSPKSVQVSNEPTPEPIPGKAAEEEKPESQIKPDVIQPSTESKPDESISPDNLQKDVAAEKPCGCPVPPKKEAIPKSIHEPIPEKVEDDAQGKPESGESKPDQSPEEIQSATESKPDESPEEIQSATGSKPSESPEEIQSATKSKPDESPEEVQSASKSKPDESPEEIQSATTSKPSESPEEIQSANESKPDDAPSPDNLQEDVTKKPPSVGRDADGSIKLPNANVKKMAPDQLQYLAMNTREHNLAEMFGDVKFVVMSVAKKKMEYFTNYIKKEMGIQLPLGAELVDISKAPNRYAMYKIGPVLAVSHGMGQAAVNITVNEVIRLVYHAGAQNPIFLRTGTCVGIGLEPGTVVISESVFNSALNECQEISVLGKTVQRPAKLDEGLVKELLAQARADDGYEVVSAKTMSTNDFYEEQGRMNGAFCTYSLEEKGEFLDKLSSLGIKAMDLESLPFAAVTYNTGVLAANVTVVVLNRLVEDDVSIPDEKVEAFQRRPCHLVTRFIKNYYDNVDV